ncbi:MAG: DMT family transporter [Litoreibacter sp.]|nr:DMT family transporter [Litoreibacter sp.]
MSTPSYALIMLLAGIGIPLLAALNANLGRVIGAPAAASVALFSVALACTIVVTLLTGPQALAKLPLAPKHLFLAGALVAFYVLSITWIAPHFGIGNAIFFVLFGQLLSAAVIDHFGLFGATQSGMTLTRGAGIGVMGLGVFLTQIAAKP